MKKILLSIIILSTLVLPNIFSQEENKLGVHLELEYSTEITKQGDNLGGFSFFVTPSYKIGDNTTIGIGIGAKLFKTLELLNDVGSIEYREKKNVSIPLYTNAMYKFKINKTTPFVECKLGYSFFKRDYAWKSTRLFPEHEGEVDVQDNLRGGLFFSPSIGILFPIKNRQQVSMSLAYCLERFSGKASFIQIDKVEKSSASHHLAALRIGYIF